MSIKNKGFITLDSTDLFDDSDIDEEISSFLQDYGTEKKPPNIGTDYEVSNEQKINSDGKTTNSKIDTKLRTENNKGSISLVKCAKSVDCKQVTESDQNNTSVADPSDGISKKPSEVTQTNTLVAELKSNINANTVTKSNQKNPSDGISKKSTEVTQGEKNDQKKGVECDKIVCKNKNVTLEPLLKDTAVNNGVKLFITTEKIQEEKSGLDLEGSPLSSLGSELLNSTELEQEIQSFLGNEFVLECQDRKQSETYSKNKDSVTTTTKDASKPSRNFENYSVKVEVIESSESHASEEGNMEVKKCIPLNNDQENQKAENPGKLKVRLSEIPQIKSRLSKQLESTDNDYNKSILKTTMSEKEVKNQVELALSQVKDHNKGIQKLDSELGIIVGDSVENDMTSESKKEGNNKKEEDSIENQKEKKEPPSQYEKQVELKIIDIKDKLSRSSDFIINKYSKESLISRNILRNNGLICDLDAMKKCPPSERMATMCSFVIGIGQLSKDLAVGFEVDNPENKTLFLYPLVKNISEVEHNYPDHVIGAAKVFEKMIQFHTHGRGSRIHPHDAKKIWKELYIYTNKRQEMMLIIMISADGPSIIKEIYNLYLDFFKNGEGKKFRVTSIYITCCYKIGNNEEFWIEHLTGSKSIEIFRGLHLNYVGCVESWSNTYGLKMMCHAVEELLMPTRNTTVLEIFCCTGLLGQYLSKITGEVLAYDDQEVIRSTAKIALRNNVTNVQYFSGDPQSELLYRIQMVRSSSVAAIVNWNPAFKRDISANMVIEFLREVKKIQKLLVVTTSKTISQIPFRSLCAPYDMEKGEPFFPIKAIPIDTMPLQDGYIVVVLFKRQFELGMQECSKYVSRPKVKEEWWNWIKDIYDEDEKKEKIREDRKYDRREKRDNKEDEEKVKKIMDEELDRRKQEGKKKIKEEGGDRRTRQRFNDDRVSDTEDDDRHYAYGHGLWRRKEKEGKEKHRRLREEEEREKKRKFEEEERKKLEEQKRRQQLEEEMKRKLQEQLDLKRQAELERIKKEEEERKKREEEEKIKKETEEKAKRLSFLRKRLKGEQRRRAQEDNKVDIEKEQTEEEIIKKKKEAEEEQKKQAQMKGKKKQLDKIEKKEPLEQLRRQIEEEKIRAAKRTAERRRQAQVEGKRRKIVEEDRRMPLAKQRIPVWEQPPMEVAILEKSNLEERPWEILEEGNYRRQLEEATYRQVENNPVVFEYNHCSTVSPAAASSTTVHQGEEKKNIVKSDTPLTPSNTVSRPVMKWLEKLREVSGGSEVKEQFSVEKMNSIKQTSSVTPKLENLSTDPLASQNPVVPPPSLLSFHVEKPTSLLQSTSEGKTSQLSLAPLRPLLQAPAFYNDCGGKDHLADVDKNKVATNVRQSSLSTEQSKSLIEPFGNKQNLSSVAFASQRSYYGGIGRTDNENTVSGLRGIKNVCENQGVKNYGGIRRTDNENITAGLRRITDVHESQGVKNYGGSGRTHEITAAGLRGTMDVHENQGLKNYEGIGRAHDNIAAGLRGTMDVHESQGVKNYGGIGRAHENIAAGLRGTMGIRENQGVKNYGGIGRVHENTAAGLRGTMDVHENQGVKNYGGIGRAHENITAGLRGTMDLHESQGVNNYGGIGRVHENTAAGLRGIMNVHESQSVKNYGGIGRTHNENTAAGLRGIMDMHENQGVQNYGGIGRTYNENTGLGGMVDAHKSQGVKNYGGIGRTHENTAAGLRGIVDARESHGLNSYGGFGRNNENSVAGFRGIMDVRESHGINNYGGFGGNTTAGLRGIMDVRESYGVNSSYGFAAPGRYNDQSRSCGSFHPEVPSETFSFKKNFQDMKTYGPSFTGQGPY